MSQSTRLVHLILSADEPDYTRTRELDAGAVPVLEDAIRNADDDPLAAAKAVQVAALMEQPGTNELVLQGAASPIHVLRVAAAAAAQYLDETTRTQVLAQLLDDDDIGVRKAALQAASGQRTPGLLPLIEERERSEEDRVLRRLALEIRRSQSAT
jgi:HEAT repeat protein